MMSDNDGVLPQHITEQIQIIKKQLNSHSKFYSKLPQFLYKNKSIQEDMLYDIYQRNSILEGLLREIMEQELNEETFRRVSHQSSSGNNNNTHPHCTCPFCNRSDDEDEYYEEDEEEED